MIVLDGKISQQSAQQPASHSTCLRCAFLFAALGFLHWEEHSFLTQRHHPSVSQRDDGETPEVLQNRVCVFVAVLHGAEVANQQPGELTQADT